MVFRPQRRQRVLTRLVVPDEGTTYPNVSGHGHIISEVSGLTAALADKADADDLAVASDADPVAEGAADPGGSDDYSRADHVHPPPVADAPATPSVGASPWAYENTAAQRILFIVAGGTVSAFEVSVDGAAWVDLGVAAGPVVLAPGMHARVTYSSAPTVTTIAF